MQIVQLSPLGAACADRSVESLAAAYADRLVESFKLLRTQIAQLSL
ncbi:hypothetical protein MKZ21_29575 [Paenibacillus sp. FSL P2-0536]